MTVSAAAVPREALLRRGLSLERLTIGWNVLEAIVAVAAGYLAGSVALVGFGLDSVIESISGIALYRRLSLELNAEGGAHRVEQGERRALYLVGLSFFLIAAYVLYEAATSLWRREAPEQTTVGILLAALSLAVMPLLGWAKLRTARALDSRALEADSKETFVCAYLSFALLAGLGLNAALGWWWADPVAALAMLPLILHEGREALEAGRGEH